MQFGRETGVSIDLQDAYLHVPIPTASRRYLRFSLEGVCCSQGFHLPDGAGGSSSILQYFDDWLLNNQDPAVLSQHFYSIWDTMVGLGLLPNLENADLIPAQDFVGVGTNFRTDLGLMRVPAGRRDSLLYLISLFLVRRSAKARELLSLLGPLYAAADLVNLGRLHMRPLQVDLLFFWRPHFNSLEMQVPLSPDFHRHLAWWSKTSSYEACLLMRRNRHYSFYGTHQLQVGELIWSPAALSYRARAPLEETHLPSTFWSSGRCS